MKNTVADIGFDDIFRALWSGRSPFRWQQRLYNRFMHGQIPSRCQLPTGLGKTSVIAIWLIALAKSSTRPRVLPRRVVYIVNRRTVVDQATSETARLLALIENPDSAGEYATAVWSLRDALGRLTCEPGLLPLALSTLRGELADNGDWKHDPARPAIIIGTVDMIGSKLLFTGYGDGRYGRAHHAGLIGQDTLIVHDEAHLSPAFSALLWKIEREQREAREPCPPYVLELSATSRSEATEDREAVWCLRGKSGDPIFTLTADDDQDGIITQRRTASKRLFIHPCGTAQNELAKAIAVKALSYRDRSTRVLVYVRLPEDAKMVVEALKVGLDKGTDAFDALVCLLTGTLRGYERDQMAIGNPVFRDFLSKGEWSPPAQSIYLVSTSAGEVGVDFDADHLICDLTTLDSMAQRLGRVNRIGGTERSAEITVLEVVSAKDPLREQLLKTSELLRALPPTEDLGFVASPAALSKLLEMDDAKNAFSPAPMILVATDILFDSWSLTAIVGDLPGRPDVEPYLHGIAHYERPETYVAWRGEIGDLASGNVGDEDLAEVLEVFPIHAAERLKDRVDRVQIHLEAIAKRHPYGKAILIRQGVPRWIMLTDLTPSDKYLRAVAQRLLSYATVLLPIEAGGLRDGILNGDATELVHDVAEVSTNRQNQRQRVWVREGAPVNTLIGEAPVSGLPTRLELQLQRSDPDDEDSPAAVTIEYRVAKAESREPGAAVPLAKHAEEVEAACRRIGERLGLAIEQVEALAIAGRWHDHGKDRKCWQRYARNEAYFAVENPGSPLAKGQRYLHWRSLNGYRHELGSLMDAIADEEVRNHSQRDLILHLIAAHHGWARPHFRHEGDASAYDFEGSRDPVTKKCCLRTLQDNQDATAGAIQRFGLLQLRFGRWGLAWFESLVRCADTMASISKIAEAGEA